MTGREARFRKREGISEGQRVYVFHGEDRKVGVVEIVGWQTGTYKVRVGQRKYHVSMTQVQRMEATQ